MTALLEDARRERGPGVLLGSGEDCGRHPPIWSQDAARLSKGSGRIRHEHVAPPAKDAVDGLIRQIEALGIENATLDVVEAELRCAATRNLDHRAREVTDDHPSARPDERRRG